MLLEKTETHSNRKYQTANMAVAGYSLSLVGKYGVKSIFQSIKRAESHILVGDFVQNVCDEFCQGYVVARVRRPETADNMKCLINSVINSSSKQTTKKKSLPTYPIFVQPFTPI